MKKKIIWSFVAIVILFQFSACARAQECLAYIGTYTTKGSKGIYLYRMDLKTGALTSEGLAAETPNPTFLDIDAKGKFLFAADEINDYKGKAAGEVVSFAIEPGTGKLTKLSEQSSGGPGPCHVLVDGHCRDALVANYNGGSAAVLPISADGKLSPASAFYQYEGSSINKQRQEKPHAHCMALDASGHFAFVCDLGTDKVMQYVLDDEHELVPNNPPFLSITPGSGPRHLTFAPNGKFAYLLNEMAGTITVLAFDAKKGTLSEAGTISTLPDDFKGRNTSAEIAVHPAGRFVYASNRGLDSIAVFAVDAGTGKLTLVERQSTMGKTPRNFAIDPTGHFLVAANQDSNNMAVFAINQGSGKLELASQVSEITSPVCVKFLITR